MSLTTQQIPLFTRRPSRVRRDIADIHAVSRPAGIYTGDFYFTHRYDDRIWFALGDVAGKGINAAVVMAMIHEELEHRIAACATTRCDPAETLRRLDAFLRPLMPSNRFATVVIGHLREDGTLVIANGGHCPALIARLDGAIEEIGSTGPVAGLLPAARWSSVTTRLERGETLVLFSDGLSEGNDDDGCEVGVRGVREVLSRARGDVRAVSNSIMNAIASSADDQTLVVLRRV